LPAELNVNLNRIDVPSAPDAPTAKKEGTLIRLWEVIEGILLELASGSTTESVLLDEATRRRFKVGKLWSSVFAKEIELVRLSRNSVAHAKTLSSENLDASIELAKRLLEILDREISV
jgi:hypothetical protein